MAHPEALFDEPEHLLLPQFPKNFRQPSQDLLLSLQKRLKRPLQLLRKGGDALGEANSSKDFRPSLAAPKRLPSREELLDDFILSELRAGRMDILGVKVERAPDVVEIISREEAKREGLETFVKQRYGWEVFKVDIFYQEGFAASDMASLVDSLLVKERLRGIDFSPLREARGCLMGFLSKDGTIILLTGSLNPTVWRQAQQRGILPPWPGKFSAYLITANHESAHMVWRCLPQKVQNKFYPEVRKQVPLDFGNLVYLTPEYFCDVVALMRASFPVPAKWGGMKKLVEDAFKRWKGDIELFREGEAMEAFIFIGDYREYLTREEREKLEELQRRYLELSPGDPQRERLLEEAGEIAERARMRVIEEATKELEALSPK